MIKNGHDIIHYADILAIPLFMINMYYFYNIENKNILEYLLLLFTFIGFICDIIFTFMYVNNI